MKYRMAYHGPGLLSNEYVFKADSDEVAIQEVNNKMGELNKPGHGSEIRIYSFVHLFRIDVEEQKTLITIQQTIPDFPGWTQKRMTIPVQPSTRKCHFCGAVMVRKDGDEGLFCPEGCII